MKILKMLLVFGWVALLFSCEKPMPKTDKVLDEEVFVEVLTDFYLYKNIDVRSTRNKKYQEINGFILQKHSVSAEEFKESFGYYMLDQKMAEKIDEQVKDKLLELAPNYQAPANINDQTLKDPPTSKLPKSRE